MNIDKSMCTCDLANLSKVSILATLTRSSHPHSVLRDVVLDHAHYFISVAGSMSTSAAT